MIRRCLGARKERIAGDPDKAHVSTSYVERLHALSLYFVFYNFCRIHKSLRVTPAMAAGISDTCATWNGLSD